MTVAIVEMTKGGVSINAWLCAPCREARKATGWTGKATKAVDHPCDDCIRDKRAPEAVDFLPTSATARIPTEAEYPRPKPMEPWAKPAKQKAKEAA